MKLHNTRLQPHRKKSHRKAIEVRPKQIAYILWLQLTGESILLISIRIQGFKQALQYTTMAETKNPNSSTWIALNPKAHYNPFLTLIFTQKIFHTPRRKKRWWLEKKLFGKAETLLLLRRKKMLCFSELLLPLYFLL